MPQPRSSAACTGVRDVRPRDVASAALEERAPRCIDLIREEAAAIAAASELGAETRTALMLLAVKLARRIDELEARL